MCAVEGLTHLQCSECVYEVAICGTYQQVEYLVVGLGNSMNILG